MIVSWEEEGFEHEQPSTHPSFPFHVKKPYFLFASHYHDSRELLMSSFPPPKTQDPTLGGNRKYNWVNDFFFCAYRKSMIANILI